MVHETIIRYRRPTHYQGTNEAMCEEMIVDFAFAPESDGAFSLVIGASTTLDRARQATINAQA